MSRASECTRTLDPWPNGQGARLLRHSPPESSLFFCLFARRVDRGPSNPVSPTLTPTLRAWERSKAYPCGSRLKTPKLHTDPQYPKASHRPAMAQLGIPSCQAWFRSSKNSSSSATRTNWGPNSGGAVTLKTARQLQGPPEEEEESHLAVVHRSSGGVNISDLITPAANHRQPPRRRASLQRRC
jgi:hypothetical protein